jgi:hypothetical protein
MDNYVRIAESVAIYSAARGGDAAPMTQPASYADELRPPLAA